MFVCLFVCSEEQPFAHTQPVYIHSFMYNEGIEKKKKTKTMLKKRKREIELKVDV